MIKIAGGKGGGIPTKLRRVVQKKSYGKIVIPETKFLVLLWKLKSAMKW